MKRLVQVDPDTYEPASVICTFALNEEEDRVTVTFADPDRTENESLHILETFYRGKKLTPASGKAYFDAIDGTLRSSFCFVETIPDDTEDPIALKGA